MKKKLKDEFSKLTLYKVWLLNYNSDKKSKIISEGFIKKKKRKKKKEKIVI